MRRSHLWLLDLVIAVLAAWAAVFLVILPWITG
jgi:hypothetical protein